MSRGVKRATGTGVRLAWLVALVGLVAGTLIGPAAADAPIDAPIDDLRAQAAQLQAKIDEAGAKVAALGEEINGAQIEVDEATARIAEADARFEAAQQRTRDIKAIVALRVATIYSSASSSGPLGSLELDDETDSASASKYADVAAARDEELLDELAAAKDDTRRERGDADEARAAAGERRDELAAATADADAAASELEGLLAQVEGEIGEIIRQEAAAREQAAREQAAREQAAREQAAREQAEQEAQTAAATPAPADAGGDDAPSGGSAPSGGEPSSSGGSAPSGGAPSSGGGGAPSGGGGAPSSGGGGGGDGGGSGTHPGAGAAVSYAQAQVGKPYCWGGSGPNCYDCSGLTMMAWRQGGVSMPHYSGAQGSMFPSVSLGALQPGDLVTTSSWSQHIGIWVGGGFVHATHTGDFIRYVPGSSRLVAAVRPG